MAPYLTYGDETRKCVPGLMRVCVDPVGMTPSRWKAYYILTPHVAAAAPSRKKQDQILLYLSRSTRKIGSSRWFPNIQVVLFLYSIGPASRSWYLRIVPIDR